MDWSQNPLPINTNKLPLSFPKPSTVFHFFLPKQSLLILAWIEYHILKETMFWIGHKITFNKHKPKCHFHFLDLKAFTFFLAQRPLSILGLNCTCSSKWHPYVSKCKPIFIFHTSIMNMVDNSALLIARDDPYFYCDLFCYGNWS